MGRNGMVDSYISIEKKTIHIYKQRNSKQEETDLYFTAASANWVREGYLLLATKRIYPIVRSNFLHYWSIFLAHVFGLRFRYSIITVSTHSVC